MREQYATVASLLRSGAHFSVATLTATRTSRPAPIGTSLIVFEGGGFAGNIGAGCHESEIVEAGQLTLKDGVYRSLEFDLNDDLLDGSACGASLSVAVWKPLPDFLPIAGRIARGDETVTIAIGDAQITILPRRRLIVVGATELASHLTTIARSAEFHVTIVDPRPTFATRRRQPDADDLIVRWPQDVLPALLPTSNALVVMAHDVKLDLPALRCALDSEVPYVGALGSVRSQHARREALAELGYDEHSLDRIHGPVGLDLGAVTSSQIACAILAEILKVLNRRSGNSLSQHRDEITRESSEMGDVESPHRTLCS
jgi:xanthine dehydrogenase accessory factor